MSGARSRWARSVGLLCGMDTGRPRDDTPEYRCRFGPPALRAVTDSEPAGTRHVPHPRTVSVPQHQVDRKLSAFAVAAATSVPSPGLRHRVASGSPVGPGSCARSVTAKTMDRTRFVSKRHRWSIPVTP